MNKNQMLNIENYFEGFLIISLLGLFLFMIKSYLTPILFAAVLVFLTFKPYKKLLKLTHNKTLSAFLIFSLIILILIYPTYWLTSSLVSESSSIFEGSKELLSQYTQKECDGNHICEFFNSNLEAIALSLNELTSNLKDYFVNSIFELFDSFATFFINFFVFLLGFFFLLRDGEKFLNYIKKIIPMKNSYKNALFLKFKDVLVAVFFNTIFLAILQGFLVGIGFWVVGINSPLFWGIIASFAALLPILGPATIWIPGVVYLVLVQDYTLAIGLSIYGLLLVGLIDNIVRPLFLTKSLEVHEFLVLLAVLGGIQIFGFFLGLFLGPVIISFLVAVLNLYHLEFK